VYTLSNNTGIQSFKNSFTALSIVPWVKLSFAAFPWVQRYIWFWTTRVFDFEYFPRRSDPENSVRVNLECHISLIIQSKQLFHIRFCMRFSAMRFSMKVFEHAKIARWRHCNANTLKTPKASYMSIRLLCVYISVKFCFEIPSDCWENCKKSWGLLFCRTLYIENDNVRAVTL